MVLVQSMEGGFVTAICYGCGKKETFIELEFRSLQHIVSCPKCKEAMTPKLVEKNYSYVCEKCELYILLADLLPHWKELKQ